MANILDRYGIKEVADVTFYDLDNNGMPTHPVLYLDTLKVSTNEQTAEEAEARGGKGNAALIAWDYGKEINVTLEDALFSAKSMAIMFGNGTVKDFDSTTSGHDYIMKTVQLSYKSGEAAYTKWTGPDGKLHDALNPKYYDAKGNELKETAGKLTGKDGKTAEELAANERYLCTFDLKATGAVIEVSGNSFPGTYYVVGDTFARSEASGNDEMFQFIIHKAKVTSENTITLEAEGDPSVFNMSLKVLRPADGIMMKLVKYNLDEGTEADKETSLNLVHNHVLKTNNESELAQG